MRRKRNSFGAAHVSHCCYDNTLITSTLNQKDHVCQAGAAGFIVNTLTLYCGFQGTRYEYYLPVAHLGPPTGAQVVQQLAREVDGLTPRVVEAALAVRTDPGNREAQERLDALRKDWADRVQLLTEAIDDIIDLEDFLAVSGGCGQGIDCPGIITAHKYTPSHTLSHTLTHARPLTLHVEANILRDMSRCRRAINDGQWEELASIVHRIAAKSRRMVDVAQSRLGGMASPEPSVTRLQKGGRGSRPVVTWCLRLCSHTTPFLLLQPFLAWLPGQQS